MPGPEPWARYDSAPPMRITCSHERSGYFSLVLTFSHNSRLLWCRRFNEIMHAATLRRTWQARVAMMLCAWTRLGLPR